MAEKYLRLKFSGHVAGMEERRMLLGFWLKRKKERDH
jgi:hypothetical protein